jgi:hypothetical protein
LAEQINRNEKRKIMSRTDTVENNIYKREALYNEGERERNEYCSKKRK